MTRRVGQIWIFLTPKDWIESRLVLRTHIARFEREWSIPTSSLAANPNDLCPETGAGSQDAIGLPAAHFWGASVIGIQIEHGSGESQVNG